MPVISIVKDQSAAIGLQRLTLGESARNEKTCQEKMKTIPFRSAAALRSLQGAISSAFRQKSVKRMY
jgi:hypothetical protein